MKQPKVIVILGQTATGKSALAIQIALRLRSGPSAQKRGGEIISADSRQVYKGLDIGTGKITEKEMKGIPHHLIDIVNPKRPANSGGKFTVAEYQKKAIYAIADIIKRNKVPIICGGTGFYIDAITKGIIFPEVPPNEKLRRTLYSKSAIALFEYLKKLDKNRAQDIKNKNEQNNKVRLIRAIEIAKAIGNIPKITQGSPVYKFIKIGLYLPPDQLKRKIEKRVKKMFQDGLLDEIKKLKKSGISQKRLKEFGFEYDNPTYEKVVKETIKYAKRQMTWFKKPARPLENSGAGGDKTIQWLDTSKKIDLGCILKSFKLL
ncbi:MAG: tRNA (adenosine(37)-N6)-dimethylallyltransferase MiaA [Candidatus Paceibacterota bacterium]|jgi:tRNA dimethylallyltransferase